jgi:hypothetical protein
MEYIKNDKELLYFFNPPSTSTKKTIEEAQKIKSINDNIWKRLGYESMITRLMDLGMELDDIYNLSTYKALKILSLKNASSI